MRKDEAQASRWSSPLALAIFTAAFAGLVNAGLNWENNNYQSKLGQSNNEAARILQMLNAPNSDQAAANLSFLAEVGLISDPGLVQQIQNYVKNRKPGSGAVTSSNPHAGEIGWMGACDANHSRPVLRFDNSGGVTRPDQVPC